MFVNSGIIHSRVKHDIRGIFIIKFILRPPYHDKPRNKEDKQEEEEEEEKARV